MEETIIQGNPEITEKQENVALGIVGALIGGLLGGASIFLLGQQGIYVAFSGVILAICTLKGYEILGKKLSTLGIIISIVVMLVTPYFASRVIWALIVVRDLQWQFVDAFKHVHEVIAERGKEAEYWKDLLFVYAFVVLSAFGTIKQAFKKK